MPIDVGTHMDRNVKLDFVKILPVAKTYVFIC